MSVQPAEASAPGKAILFGEHAVVYGQPAIAIPVTQLQAKVTVAPAPPRTGVVIVATDLDRRMELEAAPPDEPLAVAARLTLAHLNVPAPDLLLTIRSTIPIAGGLGSGAAVSTALIRALSRALGRELAVADLSALVFEVEKIHHGTPSGIDNTVIAYAQPVYFVRGHPIQRLSIGTTIDLVIADSGAPSPTGEIVGQVRQHHQGDPAHYDALFDQIGDVTEDARVALEGGDVDALGELMDANHALLVELGVSSRLLDDLVEAARFAGAIGAKLSGAGRGGNVIALAREDDIEDVAEAMSEAGAVRAIHTQVKADGQ